MLSLARNSDENADVFHGFFGLAPQQRKAGDRLHIFGARLRIQKLEQAWMRETVGGRRGLPFGWQTFARASKSVCIQSWNNLLKTPHSPRGYVVINARIKVAGSMKIHFQVRIGPAKRFPRSNKTHPSYLHILHKDGLPVIRM
jgi:hypothetical protein